MPLLDSESIILKTYNLAEADRIVAFYTRDHGLIRGVAKGAKRLKSKFGSSLEPFSLVRVEFFLKEERELVSIQHVELVRSSFENASDPNFLHTFAYLADLVIAIAPPNDPNETLYRMVRACLESKASSREELAAIKFYFEVWILRLGGYLPDWTACRRCSRVLSETETGELDSEFHILCGNCSRARGIAVMSPLHRDLVGRAQSLGPNDFLDSTEGQGNVIAEMSETMTRIIVHSTGSDKAVGTANAIKRV